MSGWIAKKSPLYKIQIKMFIKKVKIKLIKLKEYQIDEKESKQCNSSVGKYDICVIAIYQVSDQSVGPTQPLHFQG